MTHHTRNIQFWCIHISEISVFICSEIFTLMRIVTRLLIFIFGNSYFPNWSIPTVVDSSQRVRWIHLERNIQIFNPETQLIFPSSLLVLQNWKIKRNLPKQGKIQNPKIDGFRHGLPCRRFRDAGIIEILKKSVFEKN